MRHTYGQDIPTDKETNIQTKASSRQTDRCINMAYDDSKLKKLKCMKSMSLTNRRSFVSFESFHL